MREVLKFKPGLKHLSSYAIIYLHPRRQLTPIAGKKVKARREGSNQKQGYHFGNKRLQDRDLATICSRENIKLILSHCYGSIYI